MVGPEPRGHFRVQTVLSETGVQLAVAEYLLDLIVIEPEESPQRMMRIGALAGTQIAQLAP